MSMTNGMKRIKQLRESLYGPITDDAQMLADYTRGIKELESLTLTTKEEKQEANDLILTLSQAPAQPVAVIATATPFPSIQPVSMLKMHPAAAAIIPTGLTRHVRLPPPK